MSPKEQELMERYIYQVVRRLPRAQQDEVGMELRGLIEDMQEERGEIEQVLCELGDPAEFAKKYSGREKYLIGPAYYDTYLWFLKVVLACVALSVALVLATNGILKVDSAVSYVKFALLGIAEGVVSLFTSCIAAVGGVTVLFALLERKQVKIEQKIRKQWKVQDLADNFAAPKWTPRMLSPIPHPNARIKRSDSVTDIVFTVVLSVLLIFAPQLFGPICTVNGRTVLVPFLNLEQWSGILPFVLLLLAAGLIDEVFRLVNGCYCRRVMVCSLICSSLQLVLSVVVLKVLPLWNPHINEEVAQLTDPLLPEFLRSYDITLISNVLLAIIVLGSLAGMGVTVYKTLRYGCER